MLTLYHYPKSRSVRARWLLEELAIPYQIELVDLPSGAHKRPGYLLINPNGAVPALGDAFDQAPPDITVASLETP